MIILLFDTHAGCAVFVGGKKSAETRFARSNMARRLVLVYIPEVMSTLFALNS